MQLAWAGGLAAVIGMVAGAALQLREAALQPVSFYLGATALGGLALATGARGMLHSQVRALPVALTVLSLIGAIAVGWGTTGWRAQQRLAQSLAPALEGRDLEVTGTVVALPQRRAEGVRFAFEIDSARLDGQAVRVPAQVMLGWYRGLQEGALLAVPDIEPRAGERWRLPVRLRRPHGSLNPHGFDFELWLFEQGVRATGYVRAQEGTRVERLADAGAHPVERARQWVRDALDARLGQSAAAGVLAALAIGDQAAIEREDWDVFRQTGVAHLMSISGLHVTMFAWLAAALVQALWRRSTRALLWWPAVKAGWVGGIVFALGYAVFAGWGVPAQRTVFMLAVAACARLAGLRWPWPLVWGAALWGVTLLDPWALLQPGFWLSFMAVGLLMASSGDTVDIDGRIATDAPDVATTRWQRLWFVVRGGLRTQAVATIGLAPLTLVFFQQLSLVGFIANLVAIPLVTLAITPLALLGCVAAPAWTFAAWLTARLIELLGWLAALPWATWEVPAAPGWAALGGLLGAALLVLPLPWRWRWLGLPMLVPLLWPVVTRPAAGEFDLLAADIGQGTAVLVRTAGHSLLYDTGPQYARDNDAGTRVLVPLLRALGERRLDMLVLSHRDTDHVGGAAAVLRARTVDEMQSSLEPGHPLLAQPAARRSPCVAGTRWEWDGVRFEMLHPTETDYARAAQQPVRPNAMSCVLRISASAGGSALLTGDIERDQEIALVEGLGDALASTVLLVPHHGSRTSSTNALLDTVRPRVAVVQAGYRNRFGHPAPDVVARYEARQIPVVRSDLCGAWHWNSAKVVPMSVEGATVWCERSQRRRYWHAPIAGDGPEFAIPTVEDPSTP